MNSIHAGEFKNPQADLEALVQASQALELLKDTPSPKEICTIIKKNSKALLEKLTVTHVYNLAEVHRMFKCDTLKGIPE